jgi:hypothetical protein
MRHVLRLGLATVATVAGLVVPSVARAQVVYEPVQYQFGGQNPYYYGGTDPRVHGRVASQAGVGFGRVNGFDFVSGTVNTHRAVTSLPARVFTDAYPGYDARTLGFTASDARNEAYANTPRYFRKIDLLRTGTVVDGALHVPATPARVRTVPAPGSIEIKPYVRPATGPAREPRPVLILPREGLDRPLPDANGSRDWQV